MSRIFIAGHSFGGATAIATAATFPTDFSVGQFLIYEILSTSNKAKWNTS